MASQYPAGVLLDAYGNPFDAAMQVPWSQNQDAPPGAYLPGAPVYGPTTIIIEPGGGRVELTERDAELRTMQYADVWASQSPIAAVVEKMRRRLAILPRKVYKRPPRGQSQNGLRKFPAEDDDNTLHDLLHKPAPGYGRMSLTEWQALSFIVNGNSLLAKFRGNGDDQAPTEVIPLDWRFAQAWARIGTPVIMWATVQTGMLKWISPSETIHTMWTSVAGPNGAWLGTSALQQLGVTIKIDEAAAAYAAAHFKNAARPGGVITLPPNVNVQQNESITDRLQKRADEAYGGVDKAFKLAVLGGGATWTPWGQTAEQAQLVETRQQDFREVCAVLDMPYESLYGTAPTTPESDAQVWKALMPWAFAMDDRLQAQLVDPEPEWAGLFVKSDFNEVLFGDPLVLSDKMVAEVLSGLRSVDEGRMPLGLDPRGGASDMLLSDQDATGGGPTGPDGQPIPPEQEAMTEARTITAIERV